MARAIRSTPFVALVLVVVVACGPIAPVKLLTYDGTGCHVAPAAGQLVVDPKYGTAIWYEFGNDPQSPRLWPVAWPPGFSGRDSGGEIEVVAPDGRVVAVTGRRYALTGGGVPVDGITGGAFWACAGDPMPQ